MKTLCWAYIITQKMSAMIARMDALERNNEALKSRVHDAESMVDYLMKSLNI